MKNDVNVMDLIADRNGLKPTMKSGYNSIVPYARLNYFLNAAKQIMFSVCLQEISFVNWS
jgi:hypothetical protein